MKIVFMGTPDFAVPSLNGLAESHHEVIGVVTGQDKQAGRGLRVRETPIKKLARRMGAKIFQPAGLGDPVFTEQMRKLEADLYVVVAFRILPPAVFRIPPKGTINVHASLLPKYRGAAPINWAIINGETETGITTFFIEESVDTGDLILQKSVAIEKNETAGELHDKLARVGAEALLETVDAIACGEAPSTKQSGKMTKAPKLTKDLARIRWDQTNLEIHNLVRGLSPLPGAFTLRNGKILKVYKIRLTDGVPRDAEPGKMFRVENGDDSFAVATGSGAVEILELQPEGKRRMMASEYLKGHTLKIGEQLG